MIQATTKKSRNLFINKNGLPKKEKLMSNEEIIKEFEKLPTLEEDPYKRCYLLNRYGSLMNYIGNHFRNHSMVFIQPKIKGQRKYGFSENEDYRKQYYIECKQREERQIEKRKQIDSLLQGQLKLNIKPKAIKIGVKK